MRTLSALLMIALFAAIIYIAFTRKHVDLPEEIQAASKGDLLIVDSVANGIIYIGYKGR